MTRLPRLLRVPWRSSRIDVDDELRFHLEMAASDLMASGLTPDQARAEAERRFGEMREIRAAVLTIDERRRRSAARAETVNGLLQDLRYAVRSLRRTPMLTIAGTLTLMLGVGATTAVFSVMNGVLLRPLPYPEAERLVWLGDGQGEDATVPLSYPEFIDWRERGQNTFTNVGAWFSTTMTLTGVDEPVVLQGNRVSSGIPVMLGVRPLLGRNLSADDDLGSSPRVVMLSETAWRRHFGGDSAILGRTLDLAGFPHTVIGVYPSTPRTRLPGELNSPRGSDYWAGLRLDESRAPRGLHFMSVMAATRPDLTEPSVRAGMSQVTAQLLADSITRHKASATPLATRVLGPSRDMLFAMFGAVVLVLLVACGNVGNLLLARMNSRRREIAIRTALGAARSRILAETLFESIVRAMLGGVLGVGVAWVGIRLLGRSSAIDLPRFVDVAIDGRVLTFALVLSLATGVIVGLVPALRLADTDASGVMREGGRGHAGSLGRDRFRRAMITGEIVLSFVLLVGAGLFLRSFDRLLNVPRGFESDGVLAASVSLPVSRYPDSIAQVAFYQQLEERIAAIPGVTSVATAANLPVAGGPDGSVGIEGRSYEPGKGPHAVKRLVSPTFFRTIESRMLTGRDFSPGDQLGSLKVAIVNEAFARRYFPGESAVGKRIDFSWETTGLQTIVGVVQNVKEQSLAASTEPAVYLPSTQRTSSFMFLVVRASVDELSLVPAVRRELRELDQSIPLDNVQRLEAVIDNDVASVRLMASLLTIFAIAAALLAAIGLYGVATR